MLYSNPVPIIPRNLKTSRVYLMAATSRRLKKVCNKASLSNTSYSMEHSKRIDVYVDWFVFVLVQLWGPVDPVSISYQERHHGAPSSHRVSPSTVCQELLSKTVCHKPTSSNTRHASSPSVMAMQSKATKCTGRCNLKLIGWQLPMISRIQMLEDNKVLR